MSETFLQRFSIIRVASASPRVSIADPEKNVENILSLLERPELCQSSIIVLPELCITGYTCGDLFLQSNLIAAAEEGLIELCRRLYNDQRVVAVGLPLLKNGELYNCAALICEGELIGVVPKIHIPNYQEFYEKRWFSSGENIVNQTINIGNNEVPFGTNLIFSYNNIKIGVEICEDLWVPSPPSSLLCMEGAEVILNLSATDDNIGKYDYIKALVTSQSARCRCAYAYASAGAGESSSDLVFSGINIIAFNGKLMGESKRFTRDTPFATAFLDIEKIRLDRRKFSSFHDLSQKEKVIKELTIDRQPPIGDPECKLDVNPFPFIPESISERQEKCEEIINIQSWGLAQRLMATGCKSLVVGISGGLDSTLALLIAHFTFKNLNLDLKGLKGVTMPAKATSSRTYTNALKMMQYLGIDIIEIPIKKAVDHHFNDIGHDPTVYDAVYENSQARERTQILMDLANKFNGMVIGTGDMSELALGWCTYNGDHMSMYNVNAGVPKTLVKYLVEWFADFTESDELAVILKDVVNTPISPELVPSSSENEISQKTEEIVGPYELHDFFLYHVLRNGFSPSKIMFLACAAFLEKYDRTTIKKWLINFYRRFFSQQFKRSCMPDGPKIGSVCLSPRGDWRMPSDASCKLWIKEAESLSI